MIIDTVPSVILAVLVGIATLLLLELHAGSSLAQYYKDLDDEHIKNAAKHYAMEAFKMFSPTPLPV